MTAIEFFDRTPVENIIGALTAKLDKVIFIGQKEDENNSVDFYTDFLNKMDIETVVDYRAVDVNKLDSIVDTLVRIVEKEDDIVFELTGGTDLELTAVGMVYQMYKDVKKIRLQRFDIEKGVVTDCDNDGSVVYSGLPRLSVTQNIAINGGAVRFGEKDNHTYEWMLGGDFINDVMQMWSVCKDDPVWWNNTINSLMYIDGIGKNRHSLSAGANVPLLKERIGEEKYGDMVSLLNRLKELKLIFGLRIYADSISYTFKNEQVKKCLIKAGTVLELKVLITAKNLRSKCVPYYNDCLSGVYIDWDGEFHGFNEKEKDTGNEIDVVLMRGLMPIFISCKNGQVEEDELYKLDAVTRRFGGVYARTILISTVLRCKKKNIDYFRQRAEDMGIRLIENVHKLSDADFEELVKGLAE